MSFAPLPETVRETRALEDLWRRPGTGGTPASRVLLGAAADEAAFKTHAPASRILHLATHAFFLGDDCASALDAPGGRAASAPDGADVPAVLAGENPLLLSGLALAGANSRERAAPDQEDGILTGEEIAALDLSGVEWAVLSACDTGVGSIRAGEGVFGLRRAFQIAGARTLIMSLWKVDDRATRRWMRELYTERFESRVSTAEAVRRAHVAVLAARREREQSTHPFYWAGFVAAGDWR